MKVHNFCIELDITKRQQVKAEHRASLEKDVVQNHNTRDPKGIFTGYLAEQVFNDYYLDAYHYTGGDTPKELDFLLDGYKIDLKSRKVNQFPKSFFQSPGVQDYLTKWYREHNLSIDCYAFMDILDDFSKAFFYGIISIEDFKNGPMREKIWSTGNKTYTVPHEYIWKNSIHEQFFTDVSFEKDEHEVTYKVKLGTKYLLGKDSERLLITKKSHNFTNEDLVMSPFGVLGPQEHSDNLYQFKKLNHQLQECFMNVSAEYLSVE